MKKLYVRGLLAGGLMGLAALAGLGGKATPADAAGICPSNRICISELEYTSKGDLYAAWHSRETYDAYNVIWDRKDGDSYRRSAEGDIGDSRETLLTDPIWPATYRISVQGCDRNFLSSSDCTPWATREITLRAPKAPTNVRVINGEKVTWESDDPYTLGFRLVARYKNLHDTCAFFDSDPFSDLRDADTRSVSMRESACNPIDIEGVKVCAVNPAERSVHDVCSPFVAVANNYRDPKGPELTLREVRPVSGNESVRVGGTAQFDVVVNSLGRRPGGPVTVVISGDSEVTIKRASAPGPDAARNFTCTGEMGGEGDAIQQTIAVLRIEVKGLKAGRGSIRAEVDPSNRIAERDDENNVRTLAIDVK